eukprot:2171930-Amphidinium_carterae.1
MQVGSEGCKKWDGDETACASSFISHGNRAVPCYWMACSGECLAQVTHMVECPEEEMQCSCSSVNDWSDT